MAMRQSGFAELLDTPLRKVFFLFLKEVPTEHGRWINKASISRAYEDDYIVSEFGAVPSKVEGASVQFEDAVEGSTKRYQPTPYGLGFIITREMWDDDLHNVMKRMTQALKRSFRNLFEVEAYKILNNATSATGRYAGLDGLALLSTAHTRLDTGATQSNKPSTDVDISYTAVQSAMLSFHGWLGEKGLPILFNPSTAIVSGTDQFNASLIFKNAGAPPNTADRDKNFVTDGPDGNSINNLVISRYLTDTDSWFILSDKSQHNLRLVSRVEPEFEMADDFATGNVQAKGYARVISGFSDWRGVYGSTGS
jgi:hypothetical protein